MQALRKELNDELETLTGEYKAASSDATRQQIINRRRQFESRLVDKAIPLYRQSESARTNIQSIISLASSTKGIARSQLFDIALELHGESPDIRPLMFRFGQDVPAPEVHNFLKGLANRSPHKEIKGWSTQYQAALAVALREMPKETRKKFAASYGESFNAYEQQ